MVMPPAGDRVDAHAHQRRRGVAAAAVGPPGSPVQAVVQSAQELGGRSETRGSRGPVSHESGSVGADDVAGQTAPGPGA